MKAAMITPLPSDSCSAMTEPDEKLTALRQEVEMPFSLDGGFLVMEGFGPVDPDEDPDDEDDDDEEDDDDALETPALGRGAGSRR